MYFLCSVFLIVSQVTATTATPPVTVVCSGALPITLTVTIAPISVGLAASGQYDVVLSPKLILRDTMRGSVGLATVPQWSTSVPDVFSSIYQLCHGSSLGEFSSSELSLP